MRISVYIDGYNLYYGALKANDINQNLDIKMIKELKSNKRKLRWLNVEELVKCFLIPPYNINKINFYTADVTAFFKGDKAPLRQKEYYKALGTIDNLIIHKGRFYKHKTSMPLYPITDPITMVNVLKTEEKGSDVNLATHLVYDACKDIFDMAVVITNDSDLLEPLKITQNLNKSILILCPHKKYCHEFSCTFGNNRMRNIEASHLKKSQFNDILYDSGNNIIAKRPDRWK